jgi:hypothetical protein
MKPVVVVYGDCQAMALVEAMRRVPAITSRFDICRLANVPAGAEPPAPPIGADVWRRCIAFWVQTGTSVPPAEHVADLPATARRLSFAAFFVSITFPFGRHDPVMRPTPVPALYGYADQFLMQLSEGNLSGPAAYLRYEALHEEAIATVDRGLESIARMMVERDRAVDVPIAGHVLSRTAERRLFWTPDHPTAELSAVQLERLLQATFPAETKRGGALFGAARQAFDKFDPLDGLQYPISRAVADRLGLRWWAPDYAYKFREMGKSLTLREFVMAFVEARRRKLAQQREAEAAAS